MCFVRVILRQLVAGIALQTFVCLFMQFSLSVEELSGTVEERCTAEWVQSAYTTSEWTSLVLLRCFCTPYLFFRIPLSHFFTPCILFCLAHPANPMLSIWHVIACLYYSMLLYAAIRIGTSHYILCQCLHVAWLKSMACQLCLSACCISNENCF